MAIDKKASSEWFHSGRGSVSAELAKSDSEVLSQEAEEMEDIFPAQDGKEVNDSGAKPIYSTGSTPFHSGRGNGRGYSKD